MLCWLRRHLAGEHREGKRMQAHIGLSENSDCVRTVSHTLNIPQHAHVTQLLRSAVVTMFSISELARASSTGSVLMRVAWLGIAST